MVFKINKYLLWHLFAGTRGGVMRMRIVKELENRPMNANQITELLRIDYKTTRHHLRVLCNNKLVQNAIQEGSKYGAVYHLSGIMQTNMDTFNEIWVKVNKGSKGGIR